MGNCKSTDAGAAYAPDEEYERFLRRAEFLRRERDAQLRNVDDWYNYTALTDASPGRARKHYLDMYAKTNQCHDSALNAEYNAYLDRFYANAR